MLASCGPHRMSCEQEAFVKLRKQALEKPETASSVGLKI
jgi:hypothetical protein